MHTQLQGHWDGGGRSVCGRERERERFYFNILQYQHAEAQCPNEQLQHYYDINYTGMHL